MLIDVNHKVLNMSEEEIPWGKSFLTVGKAIADALGNEYPGENLSYEEKMSRMALAKRFFSAENIHVTPGEWDTIKKYTAKRWAPFVINHINDSLMSVDTERPS